MCAHDFLSVPKMFTLFIVKKNKMIVLNKKYQNARSKYEQQGIKACENVLKTGLHLTNDEIRELVNNFKKTKVLKKLKCHV